MEKLGLALRKTNLRHRSFIPIYSFPVLSTRISFSVIGNCDRKKPYILAYRVSHIKTENRTDREYKDHIF